jgi:hypothetical protein
MKNLLNEFVLELMKDASSESFHIDLLKQKFDAWKDEYRMHHQALVQLKEEYKNHHALPRKVYEDALIEYENEYYLLRDSFRRATKRTQKATLHKWLAYSANIPEVLTQPKDDLYTIYPYVDTSFYSSVYNRKQNENSVPT